MRKRRPFFSPFLFPFQFKDCSSPQHGESKCKKAVLFSFYLCVCWENDPFFRFPVSICCCSLSLFLFFTLYWSLLVCNPLSLLKPEPHTRLSRFSFLPSSSPLSSPSKRVQWSSSERERGNAPDHFEKRRVREKKNWRYLKKGEEEKEGERENQKEREKGDFFSMTSIVGFSSLPPFSLSAPSTCTTEKRPAGGRKEDPFFAWSSLSCSHHVLVIFRLRSYTHCVCA